MKTVLQNVGAVILGLIVGSLVNMALVMANFAIFPPPEGVEMMDPEQMKEVVRGMPTAAWVLVFAAHLGQAFIGGWVAARFGASRPVTLALIVGVLSLVGGVMNAVQLSIPAWAWIEMPLYLVVAWLAARIEVRRRGEG